MACCEEYRLKTLKADRGNQMLWECRKAVVSLQSISSLVSMVTGVALGCLLHSRPSFEDLNVSMWELFAMSAKMYTVVSKSIAPPQLWLVADTKNQRHRMVRHLKETF